MNVAGLSLFAYNNTNYYKAKSSLRKPTFEGDNREIPERLPKGTPNDAFYKRARLYCSYASVDLNQAVIDLNDSNDPSCKDDIEDIKQKIENCTSNIDEIKSDIEKLMENN